MDDFVLPTGNLREPKAGAHRANAIVVTKCPNDLSENQKDAIIKRLNPKAYQKVFFSHIEYAKDLIGVDKSIKVNQLNHFTLVTGIANPKPLVQFLEAGNFNFKHLNFKDHHGFSVSEIRDLGEKDIIVTTEKDFMRLRPYPSLKNKLFYLPIKMKIHESDKFNALIKKSLKL